MANFFRSVGNTIVDLIDGAGDNARNRSEVDALNIDTQRTQNKLAEIDAAGKLQRDEANRELIKTITILAMVMLVVIVLAYVYKSTKK